MRRVHWFTLSKSLCPGMLQRMFGAQRMRTAGRAAEEDARWHIDRTMKDSTNWRVIHDLVLFDRKSDGWCQIDHVVFGRLGHFLVLETKSARQGIVLKVMGLDELDRIAQKLEEENRDNKRIRDSAGNSTEHLPLSPGPIKSSPQTGFSHVISTIVEAVANTPRTSVPKSKVSGTPCANCRGELTPKEVSYCRFNFAKLGRRYLCRKCQ